MRVVLLTESGTGIGGGHRSRCEAVAQAFEEHGDSAQILLERQEETAGAEDTPRIRHAAWSRDEDLLRGTLQGVDAAVVDSYRAPAELYALIAGLVAVTACFDDTRRLDYPPGVVINSSIGVRDQDYPEQPGRHYLLGPRFIPLRAPFWEAGPKKTRAQPRLVV
jgi:UDP-2,4-diacetamido-2,4,6-trideoxy-beta-L-altropyranose hydrolase